MKNIVKDIGFRVKELRELSDVTISEIAVELNMGEEEYIQYEKGDKDIPVSVLYEIAQKFRVDMGLLVSGEETRMNIFHITRAGKGRFVEKRKGYECEGVTDRFIQKKAETLIVTVEPKEETPPKNSHPGQEFNYVIEGSLKLYIHDQELILDKGDTIFFDSSYEHAMKALNGKKAKFLAVII